MDLAKFYVTSRLGMCLMSIIWQAKILSCHQVCVALSLSFSRWSRKAWQSISISIGKPHVMSANLSSPNFSVANSSRNGFYFSSVFDVLFDAKPSGCSLCITFPLGRVYSNLWVSTAPNASWHPSVAMMNGVLSHLGPCKTGLAIISALRFMKASVCVFVHFSFSLWLVIIHR